MLTFRTHKSLALEGISHGFFGRHGGVSTGTYASLNAGLGSADDPKNVAQNRQRIAASLGTDKYHLLSCHQHHSTDVIIAEGPWSEHYRPKADAIVTRETGVACSALAADCAPVLFADPAARIIGAAHAGWRGALAGITDQTIFAMETLGAKRDHIIAVIGPCISGANYEVGPEFYHEFLSARQENADFFTPGFKDRHYFNLKAYLENRLRQFGLAQVNALPDCTYGQPQDYFSYRYNSHNKISDYGRNISAILLTD